MISEIFYPKELKKVIADLRAKDDLREVPLNILKKEVGFISFVILVVIIFAYTREGAIAASFLTIVFAFFMSMHINAKINRFTAYTNGEKHQGVITKIVRNKVIYCRKQEGREIVIRPLGAFLEKDECLEVGTVINFYQSEKEQGAAMPDLKKTKYTYCLCKSLMEGERNV